MTTSLVIPVYNGAHVLGRTVSAALAVGADETVYVDDGSTDATADRLADLLAGCDDVRVLRHPVNRGRAAARTTGVAATSGDVLLFLDADVAPHPGYLSAHLDGLSVAGTVATVGRVEPGDLDPADPYHRYLASASRGPQQSGPTEWRFFLSGVVAVRRDAFLDAGGFDEAVPYGEDLALACALAARHRDGLSFQPRATATIYDLGTLDGARRNVARFAGDLGRIAARCPDVYRLARLERLRPVGFPGRGLLALARWQVPARLAAHLLGVVPPGASVRLVRYLLGHTLAVHAKDAPPARRRS